MPAQGQPPTSSSNIAAAETPAAPSTIQGREPVSVQDSAARYAPAILRKALSIAVAKRPRWMPPANSLDVIIGVSVSATSAENTTAAATVTPNSLNNRPTLP